MSSGMQPLPIAMGSLWTSAFILVLAYLPIIL